MIKKIIENPFLGKIEITKVGQTSMAAQGEIRIDTIYEDERGGLYIDTFITTDFDKDKQPMIFLRKEIVDIIKNLENKNT